MKQRISIQEYHQLTKKKPKYRNIRTDGFDSRLEASYIKQLDTALKGKAIKHYAIQVPFDLIVNGIKITRYVADAVVRHKDNSYEIFDCKGMETGVFKIKWRLMQALYPEYKYTLLT